MSTILSGVDGKNSWVMYLLYGAIVAFITFESIFYLIRSIRRAKKLNMDMGKIKKVITSSITFSILPAIGIGIGVVTLVGALGIAFPAIRLSVIGSLQYEAQMAGGAANAITNSKNGLTILMSQGGISGSEFLTIAVIMTIGIIWGPLFVSTFYKKLQPKFAKLAAIKLDSESEMLNEGKKNNIGDLVFSVVFIGLILGYFSMALSTVFGHTKIEGIEDPVPNWTTIYGYYNLIAIVVAAIIMAIFEFLMKNPKLKFLDDLSVPVAMLIAMLVVGIISFFAKNNGWDPTLVETSTNIVHLVL
ncbi:MAG: DUF5058 family protein [Clostridia bacterium]|nr:DUF5058 family protein [Clostridia bacterium]